LLTYAKDGGARAGLLVGDQVLDLESALASYAKSTRQKPGFSGATTGSIFANWSKARPVLAAIAKAKSLRGVKVQPLSKTRLLPPLPDIGMIYCAGANYYDHAREMGVEVVKSKVNPFFFIKAGGSTVIGPNGTAKLPKWSQKVDWEAELAVVIGKAATNVKKADAMKYVAGYTIVNDLSARDHAIREDWPFRHDWLWQKSFDASAPMGPWIVPAGDIKNPQNLKIDLWVNDRHEQDTNTNQMVFDIGEQIEDLSRQITLQPGDVISTGTGAGVGRPKGRFLNPGDRVKITIEGVGTLEHRVAAA
jgi:2-keto-4-pentenoate hydratase/2-oxohepta-3-ene-1,7-dioic acid hydratase in catechol pathway